jgi:hypothetical protein
MATQAQRRGEGRAAIRRLRQEYRKADSAGERLERELDRLTQRKTLIGPDDLKKLSDLLDTYIRIAESVQKLYILVMAIIQGLPR